MKPGELPPELAMGPCIEVWAADYKPRRDETAFPAYHARRAWRRAGDEWAERAEISKPFNWPNLARTRVPWSREHLQATGRADLADYYENGGVHPGTTSSRSSSGSSGPRREETR